MTVLDFLVRPDLVTQAWDYLRNVQTKDIKYQPLIRPQDRPAIELNQEVMARYRPAMRRLYYDPAKYKTYLDQLGIAYPTVRAADGSCAGGATP
jgi:aminobenzoyl-glutamate utilization protein B